MTPVESWMADYFWWAVGLAVVVLVWTVYLFRRRRGFDSGPKKGVPQNPGEVRRQNPPDHDDSVHYGRR